MGDVTLLSDAFTPSSLHYQTPTPNTSVSELPVSLSPYKVPYEAHFGTFNVSAPTDPFTHYTIPFSQSGSVAYLYVLTGYVSGSSVVWTDSDRSGSHGPPGVTGIRLVEKVAG